MCFAQALHVISTKAEVDAVNLESHSAAKAAFINKVNLSKTVIDVGTENKRHHVGNFWSPSFKTIYFFMLLV